MEPVNINSFRYESKYSDPGRSYTGNVAIHFLLSDIITCIFRNRTVESGYENRYFSHTVGLFVGDEYWVFSIDIDLLNIDDIEINAIRGTNKTRIHLKGDRWFDNIDKLKGNDSIVNAVAVAIVVKNLGPYLKSLFTNRNKQHNAVMAEKFASDFED